jgi:DNA-binding CsgD family transcriptional regulator
MDVIKNDVQVRPASYVLCERASGVVRFRVEADTDGGLPVEQTASLLAMHCVVRDQRPEDFDVLIVPRGALPEALAERARQLIEAGRAIGARAKISPREQEVLVGVVQNLANKEIAARLSVSVRTVKFHVSSLLVKFGVTNRAALSREAILGRMSVENQLQETTSQTLFGYPVRITSHNTENAKRPVPIESPAAIARQRNGGISSVTRERFAN